MALRAGRLRRFAWLGLLLASCSTERADPTPGALPVDAETVEAPHDSWTAGADAGSAGGDADSAGGDDAVPPDILQPPTERFDLLRVEPTTSSVVRRLPPPVLPTEAPVCGEEGFLFVAAEAPGELEALFLLRFDPVAREITWDVVEDRVCQLRSGSPSEYPGNAVEALPPVATAVYLGNCPPDPGEQPRIRAIRTADVHAAVEVGTGFGLGFAMSWGDRLCIRFKDEMGAIQVRCLPANLDGPVVNGPANLVSLEDNDGSWTLGKTVSPTEVWDTVIVERNGADFAFSPTTLGGEAGSIVPINSLDVFFVADYAVDGTVRFVVVHRDGTVDVVGGDAGIGFAARTVGNGVVAFSDRIRAWDTVGFKERVITPGQAGQSIYFADDSFLFSEIGPEWLHVAIDLERFNRSPCATRVRWLRSEPDGTFVPRHESCEYGGPAIAMLGEALWLMGPTAAPVKDSIANVGAYQLSWVSGGERRVVGTTHREFHRFRVATGGLMLYEENTWELFEIDQTSAGEVFLRGPVTPNPGWHLSFERCGRCVLERTELDGEVIDRAICR